MDVHVYVLGIHAEVCVCVCESLSRVRLFAGIYKEG